MARNSSVHKCTLYFKMTSLKKLGATFVSFNHSNMLWKLFMGKISIFNYLFLVHVGPFMSNENSTMSKDIMDGFLKMF
jgi:hypothetical protein